MNAQLIEFRDVEAGESPETIETPEDLLQQAFICKVYLIISIQLVVTTVGVAAIVILIEPLAYFLKGIGVGLPLYAGICLAAITALCLLNFYHGANYLLLWVLTIALTVLIGVTCAVASGKAIFGSAILTGVLVINLTCYTFWGASKGYDFGFLGPFLCVAIIVIIALASLQIIYPLGETFFMAYGCFGSIATCSYIVCFTDSLVIRSYSYDKYVWAAVSLFFVAKVYSIILIQLLVTVAVAAVVNFVHPVSNFISHTKAGLALYIVVIIVPFILICPLYYYYKLRPVNYLLLGAFTVALGFLVGFTCAFSSASGKVILESAALTAIAVVALTFFTFWAAKKGHDFSFLGPFLISTLIIILLFGLIQIFFPLGKIFPMIYGGLASIIFCGYIIYDTDNLIKRYAYDEAIWAAVSLYLDIIYLFFSLLTFFSFQD